MDFIVKDLDNNYKLDAFRNKADKIIFEISSEISTANCPYCGKESKKISFQISKRDTGSSHTRKEGCFTCFNKKALL